MWLVIVALALGLSAAGMVYLYTRFRKFGIVRLIGGESLARQRLTAALPFLVVAIGCFFDAVNTVIIVLHLAVFWLIADLATALWRRLTRRGSDRQEDKATPRVYLKGIAVLLACAVYLAIGRYNAYHVDRTEYRITTEKALPNGRLRVLLIADAHVGTTFDGEGLAEKLALIQAEQPDIVFVAGDFVDDGTTRADMAAACRALGSLKSVYGTYFVYGNHDKGYYNSREFTAAELEAELRGNGVTVLEDESVLVADTFYVVGRRDRDDARRGQNAGSAGRERAPIAELVSDLDGNRYTIVLNHQPNDYEAEAEAGVDLVLSGHTHGGQLIPLGPIGRLIGANDRTYGTETRDQTTYIVTSGISDWAIRYKTGTKSEYVILEITGQ